MEVSMMGGSPVNDMVNEKETVKDIIQNTGFLLNEAKGIVTMIQEALYGPMTLKTNDIKPHESQESVIETLKKERRDMEDLLHDIIAIREALW